MQNKGVLVIISGPSGSGKGTVISQLISCSDYVLSISATTRKPRIGEIDGEHYFFKTREEFKKMIENKELLEYAEFCDNFYGTPLQYVEDKIKENKNIILEIDVQGALQVKKIYSNSILIFMIPKNIKELEKRLKSRCSDELDIINKRLETAKEEVKLIKKYDYVVINNFVEQAVKEINKIVEVEKIKNRIGDKLIDSFLKEE